MPRYKKETLLAMERAKHPEDNRPSAKLIVRIFIKIIIRRPMKIC